MTSGDEFQDFHVARFLADRLVEPTLRQIRSSVRSSVTRVSPGETAEPIQFIFGVGVTLDHSNYVLNGG